MVSINIGQALARTRTAAGQWRWPRPGALVARPLGLRGRALLVSLLSAVLIFFVVETFYTKYLTENIQEEYNRHGLTIWRMFDATFPSVADLRGPLLDERIARILETNPDVHEMHVYAPQGQRFVRVASSNPATIGTPAGIDDLQPVLQDRPIWREFNHDQAPIAEIGAPLHSDGRPAAVLAIHYNLASRDILVQQHVTTFLAVGGLGGALLLGLLNWEMERLLLRPLLLLRRQANAISGGDLGFRTHLRRNDEIGELASGLDGMAEALAARAQENQALHAELRARYEEAEQRAVRDPITGLYNHRHFHERLAHEIARANRYQQQVAVLFCDLDHFKSVNDAHGHQAGDQVLLQVAEILRTTAREIDIAARYGGEEFAIILPNTEQDGALQLAERIRHQVGARVLSLAGDTAITATLSIGVALYPEDAVGEAELVHCADLAMYHAKRLGRNQVRTYGEVREFLAHEERTGSSDADRHMADRLYMEAVQSLAAAVDARDHYTHHHSSAVAHYATALGRMMGMGGTELTQIWVAGLLHDVGKIGMPDQVLGKTGALTDDEWIKMREHPQMGRVIVQHIRAHEDVVPLIYHHHERWDGRGYPGALKGQCIPLGARIIAVADTYHAMTSDRPYRKALSRSEALEILRQEAGKQFDPTVVEAFLQIPEEILASAEIAETGGRQT